MPVNIHHLFQGNKDHSRNDPVLPGLKEEELERVGGQNDHRMVI